MTSAEVITALDLPAGSRVNQRVPKKLLVENGAPTAADKRKINEGVEEIHWLAALKPTTIGVPAYRDADREYLEIAILNVVLRSEGKFGRLIELLHRAIPYPVFLVVAEDSRLSLSLAHKRWAQNEADKVVLDGDVIEVLLDGSCAGRTLEPFLQALSLPTLPRTHLFALYQGWIDTFVAGQVLCMTGTFRPSDNSAHAAARRQALQDCQRLEERITSLRSAAAKARQMAKQVELNLEIKALMEQLATARSRL